MLLPSVLDAKSTYLAHGGVADVTYASDTTSTTSIMYSIIFSDVNSSACVNTARQTHTTFTSLLNIVVAINFSYYSNRDAELIQRQNCLLPSAISTLTVTMNNSQSTHN